MAVPNIFANVTTSIPLSQLDQNFATAVVLGNTSVYLGNTTTTLGNVTLANANVTTALTIAGASGTSGQVLTSGGSGAAPTWTTVSASQWTTTGSNIYYSTGNVGINTSTPARRFEVNGAGAVAARVSGTNPVLEFGVNSGTNTNFMLAAQSNVGDAFEITPSTTAGGFTFSTPAIVINSSGNLLVNTNSSMGSSGGSPFQVSQNAAASGAWLSYFENKATSNLVGLLTKYINAAPNDTGSPWWQCNDSSALRGKLVSNGGLYNYSGNDSNLSDRREKTNFSPAKSYLNTICSIPVQTFNYIDQNLETDAGLTLGVVAQDVQSVAPELVTETNWGTEEEPKMRLSIYQTDLQYALMKSIQELKALNDTQAATIAALTARIIALENK